MTARLGVCVSVCACACVCVCVCIYMVCMCVCVCVHVCACASMYICTLMHLYTYAVYIYICMYIYVYVCVYIYIYIYIYTYIYASLCVCVRFAGSVRELVSGESHEATTGFNATVKQTHAALLRYCVESHERPTPRPLQDLRLFIWRWCTSQSFSRHSTPPSLHPSPLYVAMHIAQYMFPPAPSRFAIQHAILVMAILCKGQSTP